jgi:hypothetical protein
MALLFDTEISDLLTNIGPHNHKQFVYTDEINQFMRDGIYSGYGDGLDLGMAVAYLHETHPSEISNFVFQQLWKIRTLEAIEATYGGLQSQFTTDIILPNRQYDLTDHLDVCDQEFGSVWEALANAIEHGHKFDVDKRILFDLYLAQDRMLFAVSDEGPGFNPRTAKNPDPHRGKGLTMIMPHGEQDCYFSPKGNQWAMDYRFEKSAFRPLEFNLESS